MIELADQFESIDYADGGKIVSQGHIPIISILILEGVGHLKKKKRLVREIAPGDFVAFVELMENLPLAQDIYLLPGTKAVVIYKSDAKSPDLLRVYQQSKAS
ncbi:MAG: hypothetical protein HOE90_10545 [Bacteriovoracaceae bacterium]|jgi:hypothetical protein|nr:hypothetical protein [Bacteriovoracaceae bacterium]